MGRVEAVIHARRQAQGHKTSIPPFVYIGLSAQQVFQGVRKTLGLKYAGPLNRATGADDGIDGAGQGVDVLRNRAGAVFEFAGEAVMHAGKALFLGFAQVQVAKKLPDSDGCVPHQRLFDFAEPAQKAGQRLARNAVGKQEVQVFLAEDFLNLCT